MTAGMTAGASTDMTGTIELHYWAAARAAAGVAGDVIEVEGPTSLADVRARALTLHPGADLARVLAICSTLVDDLPVGTGSPEDVMVQPGGSVQFLPPFAGG